MASSAAHNSHELEPGYRGAACDMWHAASLLDKAKIQKIYKCIYFELFFLYLHYDFQIVL